MQTLPKPPFIFLSSCSIYFVASDLEVQQPSLTPQVCTKIDCSTRFGHLGYCEQNMRAINSKAV